MEQIIRKNVVSDYPKKLTQNQNSTPRPGSTTYMKKRFTAYIKPSDPDVGNFASGLKNTETNSLMA